ncbi:MAG: diguanylate cyclase (GGDEF)-like protein [Enterobacterales bacterium]|jgi:diguanylate cyclase (GGDEF)-like protein
MLTLADILTSNVNCLNPEATLSCAFETLTVNDYSCCVVAGENNIPLGILTERDLVRIISAKGYARQLMSELVKEHMISPPFTLPADTPLENALNLIETKDLRYLLVTGLNGAIAGIVTQSDIVKAYIRIMRDHSEDLEETIIQRTEVLETVNRKLVTLSMVDPLTGLGNRRALEVDIMKTHAAGIRHRRPYSVALFDIDYFKKYNDHYGHQAGDNVLELVAGHFRKSIREADAVFRYGGEEFLMIMPDTNDDEALQTVQRIVDSLSELNITHVDSPLEHITTSAGIASSHHQGQRLASWRQVVELADEGLYKAKSLGRNQVCISVRSTLKAVN